VRAAEEASGDGDAKPQAAAANGDAAVVNRDNNNVKPQPKPPTTRLPVTPTPISRPPASAAEMLDYFEIDSSVLRQLVDHRPLHADEHEALVNILYALPKFPLDEAARWIEKDADWAAVIAAPEKFRTKSAPARCRRRGKLASRSTKR
jgi:hypothetical protein